MTSRHTTPGPAAIPPRPLLIHSAILVLSGFLLGMAAGSAAPPDVRQHMSLAGSFGVVAYVALRLAARRRRARVAEFRERMAAMEFAHRVSRHVPHLRRYRAHTHLHPADDPRLHAPVVVRSRRMRPVSTVGGRQAGGTR